MTKEPKEMTKKPEMYYPPAKAAPPSPLRQRMQEREEAVWVYP